MKSLDGTHDIAISADDFCDVLTLGTALPKYYNAKSTIKGNLASPGSEVTFSVTANNTSTVVDSQPVISDLLPCGMTFVEDSVTGGQPVRTRPSPSATSPMPPAAPASSFRSPGPATKPRVAPPSSCAARSAPP